MHQSILLCVSFKVCIVENNKMAKLVFFCFTFLGYGKDRIIFGDVGWTKREELNLLLPTGGGSNFGWPLKQGFFCHLKHQKNEECPAEIGK